MSAVAFESTYGEQYAALVPRVHAIVKDTKSRRRFDYISMEDAEEVPFVHRLDEGSNDSPTVRGASLWLWDWKAPEDDYAEFVRNMFRLLRGNFATDYLKIECPNEVGAARYLLVIAAIINETHMTTPCLELKDTPAHFMYPFLACIADRSFPFSVLTITYNDVCQHSATLRLFDAINHKARHSKLRSLHTNDTEIIFGAVPSSAETDLCEIHVNPPLVDEYDQFLRVMQLVERSVSIRKFHFSIKRVEKDVEFAERHLKSQSPYPEAYAYVKFGTAIINLNKSLTPVLTARARDAQSALPLLVCAHALDGGALVAALPVDVLALVLRAAKLADVI